MAGRSRYSDEDKAAVLARYHANDKNLKRTAREVGVSVNTLRHWVKNSPPSEEALQKAVTEFVDDAERIRDLALARLEEKVANGDISARELITAIGVLDDKITRAKGLPTQRTEHVPSLPSREELGAMLGGFMAGAVEMAERRHAEIVDAEIVEEPRALPAGT